MFLNVNYSFNVIFIILIKKNVTRSLKTIQIDMDHGLHIPFFFFIDLDLFILKFQKETLL